MICVMAGLALAACVERAVPDQFLDAGIPDLRIPDLPMLVVDYAEARVLPTPDFGFPDGMQWMSCGGGFAATCHDTWGSGFACCGTGKCPSGWSCSELDCWDRGTIPCPAGKYCVDDSTSCTCAKSKGSCSACLMCVSTCVLYPSCPW